MRLAILPFLICYIGLPGIGAAPSQWLVEAIYRRQVDDVAVDPNAGAHIQITSYTFEVVPATAKTHVAIRRVEMSFFESDLKEKKDELVRFEELAPGERVVIEVTAEEDAFRSAEGGAAGVLGVSPSCIRILRRGTANQRPDGTSAEAPPSNPSQGAAVPHP